MHFLIYLSSLYWHWAKRVVNDNVDIDKFTLCYEKDKRQMSMKREKIKWPNNLKCAVLLTIHIDGESLYNRDPLHPSPRRVSYGKYGPLRAVDRLLELTSRKHIPCSYFIPGQIADRYPDMVKRLMPWDMKLVFMDTIMKKICIQIVQQRNGSMSLNNPKMCSKD